MSSGCYFRFMLIRLLEEAEHPAAENADEAAGNRVAQEMIVGAHEAGWQRQRSQARTARATSDSKFIGRSQQRRSPLCPDGKDA